MIERVAGKDYTTLAEIERMRALCRVEPKDRVSGCSQRGEDTSGGVVEQSVWVIRDRNVKRSTGAGEGEIDKG